MTEKASQPRRKLVEFYNLYYNSVTCNKNQFCRRMPSRTLFFPFGVQRKPYTSGRRRRELMHNHINFIPPLKITKSDKFEKNHVFQNSKTSDSSIKLQETCLQLFPNLQNIIYPNTQSLKFSEKLSYKNSIFQKEQMLVGQTSDDCINPQESCLQFYPNLRYIIHPNL